MLMFKKSLTFVVVPDSSQVSRQISIKVWYFWAALAAATILVFASFFLTSEFLTGQVNEAELARLQAENEQLSLKFENLRWGLAETDVRYQELVQKEVALRQVFGLPQSMLKNDNLVWVDPAVYR